MGIIEDYPEGDSGTEDVFIENEDSETVDVFEAPETDDVFDDPETADVFEDPETDDVFENTDIEEPQIEEVQSDSDSENGSADLLSTTEQSEEVNNEPLSDDSGSSGTASGSSEGVAYDDSGILAALSELSYNQRIICAFLALSSGINVGFLIFDRAFK